MKVGAIDGMPHRGLVVSIDMIEYVQRLWVGRDTERYRVEVEYRQGPRQSRQRGGLHLASISNYHFVSKDAPHAVSRLLTKLARFLLTSYGHSNTD